MCGIAGIYNFKSQKIRDLTLSLELMNELQAHRGPDGEKIWTHSQEHVGFAHRRLSIIDLETGVQPMMDKSGNVLCFNGEIYNYLELKEELRGYPFKTRSDTEVILAAYQKWGVDCVNHFRGMFAFALWDEENGQLFCARDRFGIKPFYYTVAEGHFYFASEIKTILPFLAEITTNINALKEYLFFQFTIDSHTLFEDVYELGPAHRMIIKNGNIHKECYWKLNHHLDFDHTAKYFEGKLRDLIEDSVRLHVRSDVPIGAYVSGGIDSGIISSVAARMTQGKELYAFTGKFSGSDLYDESFYARKLAQMRGINLYEADITSSDFIESIGKIIYHLDYPVAGPGSFAQYQVSKLATQYRKVVLGGQGGDELFGGYARYLIAYFEQCIKGAIDNTLHNGNFIVTYESIIPNLVALQNYKPLLQDFFSQGLFSEDIDKRYFRLINRASDLKDEVRWEELGESSPFESFRRIFNENDKKQSCFDKMTQFDCKTLLPALLHVEDRMSMAHGLESRVPFLDHPLVEFVATMPSNIKFKDGMLKRALINSMKHELPEEIIQRKNKMGFPVPFNEWLKKELRDFVWDTFSSKRARERDYFNNGEILKSISNETPFGRKTWGLLCLELWYQEFHDKSHRFKMSNRQLVNQ